MQDEAAVTSVEIEVLGYQFPRVRPTASEFDWDANWLVVQGNVKLGARAWSFSDPCLTTVEAVELGEWLRRVANSSDEQPINGRLGDRRFCRFVEPNISVELDFVAQSVVSLVWLFAQESAPPGATDEERYGLGVPVPVTVSSGLLIQEAVEWAESLRSFPVRGPRPAQ